MKVNKVSLARWQTAKVKQKGLLQPAHSNDNEDDQHLAKCRHLACRGRRPIAGEMMADVALPAYRHR